MTDEALHAFDKETFVDLQRKMLSPLLIAVLVLFWGWMWFGSFYADKLPLTSCIAGAAIAAITGLAYGLRQAHYRISARLFLIGLWLCIVVAHQLGGSLLFLYFLGLLSLL